MNARKWLACCAFALFLAGPAFAAMPARPALRITTLDGKSWDLAAQRGHWVIVNFWATWCVPCITEMPGLSRYVASHPDVRAIGLAYEDSAPAEIRAFLGKHPVGYPIAQLTPDKPLKDFDEPLGLPTTYLVAPDGTVAAHFIGPIDAAKLDAVIGRGRH
jgi:thiol-disulfide isomerase/thioredoxin